MRMKMFNDKRYYVVKMQKEPYAKVEESKTYTNLAEAMKAYDETVEQNPTATAELITRGPRKRFKGIIKATFKD